MTALPLVLLVDDDTFVRLLLRDALADSPVRVAEAANGEEALAAARREKPAVVLLDLFMPGKSGLEVLADLRAELPDTHVVVISSMDTELVVAQALAHGATDFIGKPFHPLEVSQSVRQALRERAP